MHRAMLQSFEVQRCPSPGETGWVTRDAPSASTTAVRVWVAASERSAARDKYEWSRGTS